MQAITRVNAEQASKTGNAEADPAMSRGRPLSQVKRAKSNLRFRRGIGDGMHERGRQSQHGKPHCVAERKANWKPVRDRPGVMGWRRGPRY